MELEDAELIYEMEHDNTKYIFIGETHEYYVPQDKEKLSMLRNIKKELRRDSFKALDIYDKLNISKDNDMWSYLFKLYASDLNIMSVVEENIHDIVIDPDDETLNSPSGLSQFIYGMCKDRRKCYSLFPNNSFNFMDLRTHDEWDSLSMDIVEEFGQKVKSRIKKKHLKDFNMLLRKYINGRKSSMIIMFNYQVIFEYFSIKDLSEWEYDVIVIHGGYKHTKMLIKLINQYGL